MYQNNPNIVNANLSAHTQSTRQAVQNALDIGHEVTIHEAPITQSGWSGAGYTTIDPATGAGGYIIEGGSNGGELKTDNKEAALIIYGFLIDVFSSAITTLIGGLAGLVKEAIGFIVNIVDIVKDCSGAGAVLLSWATLVLAVAMFALGVLLTISFGWIVAVLLGSLINSIIGAIFGGVFIPVVCKK